MQWQKAVKQTEINKFEIPANWLFIHYYEALNTLFRFENILRLFVYVILKKEFKEGWGNISIETEDGGSTTINAMAKKRKSVDDNYGYIGYNLYSPMLYLTSGELIRTIMSDAYWKHFNRYFPGSKEVIKNKFDEIGNIRNDLAHFRPISVDDVEVVKQNVKHIMGNIEEYMYNMLNINTRVPSNYDEDWFKEIKQLSNDYCTLIINQNDENEYISIRVIYKISVVRKTRSYSTNIKVDLLNFEAVSMLNQYEKLVEKCVYITESVPYMGDIKDLDDILKKSINLIFPRSTLQTNYKEILKYLEDLLATIKLETEMLKEDNTSRGKLIFMKSVSCSYELKENKEAKYSMDSNQIKSSDKNAPIEYWGSNLYIWNKDILSDLNEFPWMPVAISDMDILF
jgi:hypothetical protein